MMGVIVSVNVGLPQDVAWQGRTVRTAVWKKPVTGRIFVGRLNLDGDGQVDLRAHVRVAWAQRRYPPRLLRGQRHWRSGFHLRPAYRDELRGYVEYAVDRNSGQVPTTDWTEIHRSSPARAPSSARPRRQSSDPTAARSDRMSPMIRCRVRHRPATAIANTMSVAGSGTDDTTGSTARPVAIGSPVAMVR